MRNSEAYYKDISSQLKTYNKAAVIAICNELTTHLFASDEIFKTSDAERIMQQLRSNRMFIQMQRLGDALIQTGRHTYKIRRLYAQALIDQNNFSAAIAFLKELEQDIFSTAATDEKAKFEHTETNGLLGRVYKQLYINAKNPVTIHSRYHINQAIRFYLDAYNDEPRERSWQGINAVALLKRALADTIQLAGFPSAEELAGSILQTIQEKYDSQKADAWDFATAAEACIALNRPEEALEWMSGYARMPYCDAFELAGTLRQLEEVWQLDMGSEGGKLLLPLLRAELLRREGGSVLINVDELQQQNATAATTTNKYDSLQKTGAGDSNLVLEKVFGDESFKTYKWYMTGVDRCQAVARIGRDSSKGFGTGFLLKGVALYEPWGDELVLITNAHVISDNPAEKALRAEEAIIIIETLSRDEEFRVGEISWSSPSTELDVSIIRFSEDDQKRLQELTKGIKIYPVSKNLPILDSEGGSQRIYVIGHPFGGTLQLSFQDNILLDHESPKIHYRTPTEGGSSGSPVFNQQWDLIGLHHAGSSEMKCLNDKPGTYEANEGIWIQAIKDALNKSIASNPLMPEKTESVTKADSMHLSNAI